MKDKKDIFDLIRDNQHKLDERPSARNWKRLESKLDNRRSKGHTFLYRQIAMVAAVIALVAVISLITVLSDQQSSQFAEASKTTSTESWVVQDLETVYTDANTNIHQVVEFQKKLKGRYTNPIQEGTQAKKLLASNKTFTGRVNQSKRTADEMLVMKKLLTTTQQMEWIIGAWTENNSTVEWQKINNSTILCEEFILKEKGNNSLQFIDTKTQQSYTLVSEEGGKKVFSNKNSNRIILENINPNKFTISILPVRGISKVRIFTKSN